MRKPPHRSKKLVITAALAACLVVPASASAGGRKSSDSTSRSSASAAVTAPVPGTCAPVAASTTPFSPWADPASYGLLLGGSFEGASSWVLDAASIVSGNETFKVNSSKDSKSLSIAAGGSATSPMFCGTTMTPTVRFFAKATSVDSSLLVEILFTGFDGTPRSLPIATITGTTAWAPTKAIPLLANFLALVADDGTVDLALRFTAKSGSWQVDDVYIDPFRKG